ncbi:MAG: putative metal-binding motif-containing protein [Myxococcota bacterium]|nr:putative metal-binding motif-containing protein [Myxococcota bacterium]
MRRLYACILVLGLCACTSDNPDLSFDDPRQTGVDAILMSTDGAIQTDGMNSAVGDAAGLDLDGSVGPGSDGSQSEQNDGGIRAADGRPADGSSDSTTLDSQLAIDMSTGPDGSPADGRVAPDGVVPVLDADGDGFDVESDCNDADATVNPAAVESCDGIDNDCDTIVDEGWPELGNDCSKGVGACISEGQFQCAQDGNSLICDAVVIEPAADICDGIDNDCDGVVDENAANCCEPGQARPCGQEVGQCRLGRQRCLPNGQFGACVGAEQAQAESCNGLDDDCDGESDEGVLNACGGCGPVPKDICNGRDDDCDGSIDEGVLNACGGCGLDPSEICDDLDNDCDGEVDEGVINACGSCGAVPTEVCNRLDDDCDGSIDEGFAVDCDECEQRQPERCDGLDNDCDGAIDEGVLNACGICGDLADEACNGNDDDCDGATDEGVLNACGRCGLVPVETCNNQDDDCDGQVDEGFEPGCGDCVRSEPERCDRVDNDCDGDIDEGVLNACGACGDVPAEVCDGADNDCDDDIDEGVLNACGACGDVPAEVCDGVDNDCDDDIDEGVLNACGACGDVPAEVCDGADNDCDGTIDEGVLNDCGACGDVPAEVCDGVDDDCDGTIDEGVLNACGACGEVPAEECNGLDDDCDGQTDESLDFCVAYLGVIDGPDGGLRLGRELQVIGDLDDDGNDDVIAHGQRNGQGVISALSGASRAAIWTRRGDGPLGNSLALTGPDVQAADLLAGAPTGFNGAIRQFDRAGQPGEIFRGDNGFRLGDVMTSTPGLSGLVLAAPDVSGRTGGLLHILNDVNTYIAGETFGQRFGERVYLIPDLDDDGRADIIATVRYRLNFRSERATVYIGSSNWNQRSEQLRAGDTDASFGESIAWGSFVRPNELVFVYGAPDYDAPGVSNAGALFVVDRQGRFLTSAIRGADADGRIGRRMATYRRRGDGRDRLIVGGQSMGRIEIMRFADVGGVPSVVERTRFAPDGVGRSFGFSVAVTRKGPDGRAWMYVGEPDRGDNGAVHIYSIR